MDKNNKIIIVLLVIIAILACLTIVSITMPHEKPDNVITLDGISFNTTNGTDFEENLTVSKELSEDGFKCNGYRSDNGTGDYYVIIFDYSAYSSEENADEDVNEGTADALKNEPHQLVNGVVVYSGTKVSGVNVGKPIHIAYVQNSDLDKIILFESPDPNETAKMALTVKFN